MGIVLGSGSPRRLEILSSFIDEVEVVIPCVNEAVLIGEKPDGYVKRIVSQKMDSVIALRPLDDKRPVITADTIVVIDDLILGKPESFNDAVDMLSSLSGRKHSVITGLCLLLGNGKKLTEIERSNVFFKKLSHSEISDYLSIIEYQDKAGAYAIQDHGEMIIDYFEGSISNIIGFPLRLFFAMLRRGDLIFLMR